MLNRQYHLQCHWYSGQCYRSWKNLLPYNLESHIFPCQTLTELIFTSSFRTPSVLQLEYTASWHTNCKIKLIVSLSLCKLTWISLNIWFLQLSPSMRRGKALQLSALAVHSSTAPIEQRGINRHTFCAFRKFSQPSSTFCSGNILCF